MLNVAWLIVHLIATALSLPASAATRHGKIVLDSVTLPGYSPGMLQNWVSSPQSVGSMTH